MPSTLQLREYQHDLIDGVRESMRTTKRNLMVAPTGAGKTALAVTMMAGARDRGREFRCWRRHQYCTCSFQ